jgi:hypothetical protein
MLRQAQHDKPQKKLSALFHFVCQSEFIEDLIKRASTGSVAWKICHSECSEESLSDGTQNAKSPQNNVCAIST